MNAEIERRLTTLNAVDGDPEAQALVRATLSENTIEAVTAFVRDWLWTFDPRRKGGDPKLTPFLLWKRQEELLAEMWAAEEGGYTLFVEKSRDTGATWLAVGGYYVWRWLFFPGWAGGIGSRTLQQLDRSGDPQTVFWKVRKAISGLPRWLRPPGYSEKKHAPWTRIVNPDTGAVITGEGGTEVGRGGRSSVFLLDEFAKLARPKEVEDAVSGNTDALIIITTTAGPDSHAYSVRQREAVKKFDISWRHDPRKGPDFRDNFALRYSEQTAKRELDIDWTGDDENNFIPYSWIDAGRAMAAEAKAHAAAFPVVAGLDVSGGGAAESVLVIRQGPAIIGMWKWAGVNPVELASLVTPICESNKVSLVQYDAIGVGAGVEGGFAALRTPFKTRGILWGLPAPHARLWDDDGRLLASQRFANLKALQWWELRIRLWEAYQAHQGRPFDWARVATLPDDSQLVAQLSAPRQAESIAGKVSVESKKSLASRGVASPDRADAVVLAYAEAGAGPVNAIAVWV